MNKGFDDKLKVNMTIYRDEIDSLIKKYKKTKKYMKSPLFAVKTMDGIETYVSKLIEEAEKNG
jgi:hypothetical protein